MSEIFYPSDVTDHYDSDSEEIVYVDDRDIVCEFDEDDRIRITRNPTTPPRQTRTMNPPGAPKRCPKRITYNILPLNVCEIPLAQTTGRRKLSFEK